MTSAKTIILIAGILVAGVAYSSVAQVPASDQKMEVVPLTKEKMKTDKKDEAKSLAKAGKVKQKQDKKVSKDHIKVLRKKEHWF
jgi:hypothetical protein